MEMVHFIPPSQRRLAMHAAQADAAPVLVYGASGTGKGFIATWIHKNSPRAGAPFLEATLRRPLAEQLLEAHGGSIIIPEIGKWPRGDQKDLLTYLETKSIPLSGGTPRLIDVRVIATSGQVLEGRAQAGLFNTQLLEKLNVFRIEMPTLSKRQEEFDDITSGIMREIAHELHKEHIRGFSPKAQDKLRSYHWPGNLRELRNVLRMAVIATQGNQIEIDDLPAFGEERVDFRATREQFEKIYLLELLKTFDYDIEAISEKAKIDRRTLISKITHYGIAPEQLVT